MYMILNSYGKPDADYLQVGITACGNTWAMTMLFRLHGKEYSHALCSGPASRYNYGGISDTSFWYKLVCDCFTAIAYDVKREYPVIDPVAFRDQCCKQVKPETFEKCHWSYVNAYSDVTEDDEEGIEFTGEVKED